MKNQDVKKGKKVCKNIKKSSDIQTIKTEPRKNIPIQNNDYFFILSPSVRIEILNDL